MIKFCVSWEVGYLVSFFPSLVSVPVVENFLFFLLVCSAASVEFRVSDIHVCVGLSLGYSVTAFLFVYPSITPLPWLGII